MNEGFPRYLYDGNKSRAFLPQQTGDELTHSKVPKPVFVLPPPRHGSLGVGRYALRVQDPRGRNTSARQWRPRGLHAHLQGDQRLLALPPGTGRGDWGWLGPRRSPGFRPPPTPPPALPLRPPPLRPRVVRAPAANPLARAPLQPGAGAREDPGLHPRALHPARSLQSEPGRQPAAPREMVLDDCAEEPRTGAQAGCGARDRQRRGRRTQLEGAKLSVWQEAGKEFGEGPEGWERFRTEDLEPAAQLVPGARTGLTGRRWRGLGTRRRWRVE